MTAVTFVCHNFSMEDRHLNHLHFGENYENIIFSVSLTSATSILHEKKRASYNILLKSENNTRSVWPKKLLYNMASIILLLVGWL